MTVLAPHSQAPIESVSDPVCGHVLEPAKAAQVYELRGQRFYFDAAECLQQFLQDPEKFIEAPEEPDED